jgi:hypothetical protein
MGKKKVVEITKPAATLDNTIDMTSLVASTMFLRVRFSTLGNSQKIDGAASILNTDANTEKLKLSATLLESPQLVAIRQADTALRKWLKMHCLPSFDTGFMIVPNKLFKQTRAKLNEFKDEIRPALVKNFLTAYPELVKESKKELGSLSDRANYPTLEEAAEAFDFKWNAVTFDVPGKLKKLDPEAYAEELDKAEAQIKEAAVEVTAVMRQACFQLVNHLKERLAPGKDGKAKILKESAINNLKEFLNTFELRNVTNDTGLATEVSKIKSLLNGTDAVSLRTNEEFRAKILKGMENVSGTLGKMVEDKAGRKFKEV